jgi:hypothetical protein
MGARIAVVANVRDRLLPRTDPARPASRQRRLCA